VLEAFQRAKDAISDGDLDKMEDAVREIAEGQADSGNIFRVHNKAKDALQEHEKRQKAGSSVYFKIAH